MKPITLAKKAAMLLKKKAANDNIYFGRNFDNCFESGNGDMVIVELARLCMQDSILLTACRKLDRYISIDYLLKKLDEHNIAMGATA